MLLDKPLSVSFVHVVDITERLELRKRGRCSLMGRKPPDRSRREDPFADMQEDLAASRKRPLVQLGLATAFSGLDAPPER